MALAMRGSNNYIWVNIMIVLCEQYETKYDDYYIRLVSNKYDLDTFDIYDKYDNFVASCISEEEAKKFIDSLHIKINFNKLSKKDRIAKFIKDTNIQIKEIDDDRYMDISHLKPNTVLGRIKSFNAMNNSNIYGSYDNNRDVVYIKNL